MASNSTNISAVGMELKMLADTFASLATDYMEEQFNSFMESMMDKYYSEYSPKSYKRWYQLMDHSYEIVNAPVDGFSNVSLDWTPENMCYPQRKNGKNGSDPELVIESFLNATHGGYVAMGFDPYKSIINFQKTMKKELSSAATKQKILNEAKARCGLKIIR